jgi:hypothetical protein
MCENLEDNNSYGKMTKIDAVPSVTDCQKDEAKVHFMDLKCKTKAEPKVKAAEGKGKKGSANTLCWCNIPRRIVLLRSA